jgi:hypothetical protein
MPPGKGRERPTEGAGSSFWTLALRNAGYRRKSTGVAFHRESGNFRTFTKAKLANKRGRLRRYGLLQKHPLVLPLTSVCDGRYAQTDLSSQCTCEFPKGGSVGERVIK